MEEGIMKGYDALKDAVLFQGVSENRYFRPPCLSSPSYYLAYLLIPLVYDNI